MKDPDYYTNPYSDLLRAWRRRLEAIRRQPHHDPNEFTFDDGQQAALEDCMDELSDVIATMKLREGG